MNQLPNHIKECWCGAMVEGRTEQCATHNALDRKNARQEMKAQVVKPVKKVSEKRSGEMAEYLKLKREYLALYPVCEVEECNIKAIDIHHQRGREGARLLDTNFFMSVCRAHHNEFTEHSKKAIESGYSELRTTNHQKL